MDLSNYVKIEIRIETWVPGGFWLCIYANGAVQASEKLLDSAVTLTQRCYHFNCFSMFSTRQTTSIKSFRVRKPY